MTQFQPNFYYFLCNPGSEKFLKEEIKLIYPELAFAFSVPGFVTFKELMPLGKTLRPVFCRHFGIFLKRGSFEEVTKGLRDYLYYDLNGEVFKSHPIKDDQWVKEVIKVSETQYYLGEFRSSLLNSPVPGGFSKIQVPKESPSRAYLNVAEALEYLNLTLPPGDNVLEFGSSPGGSTYALLERGLKVDGVDPAFMDNVCMDHPNFVHHKTSIQKFELYNLRDHMSWLFVDMNLAPEATLGEIEHIIEKIGPSLKGVFFTLKMAKFEMVKRVPMYLTIIERMGLRVVMSTQLSCHKQEFLIYAK